MPEEILPKLILVKETLEAKGFDLDEVQKGRAVVGQDLMCLPEKLTDEKSVDTSEKVINRRSR